MNERIKELMIQTDNHFGWCLASEDLVWCEKFAESIIKKCLEQCYYRGMNDERYAGQLKAAAYIEEYFGVEE